MGPVGPAVGDDWPQFFKAKPANINTRTSITVGFIGKMLKTNL